MGNRYGALKAAAVVANEADVWAMRMVPIVRSIREAGIVSVRGICRELNYRCIPTSDGFSKRGKTQTYWYPTTVKRLLERFDDMGINI